MNVGPRLRSPALRSLPGIEEDFYQTPYLSDRLDFMEVPLEWVSCNEEGAFVHLLSYPFLFAPSVLISYFRAINYNGMSKAFEGAKMAYHLASRMTFTDPRTNRGAIRVQTQLRIAQSRYFVLEVRREDLLADAMNQLWRRQKRELMRPLKVCIGSEEGEEGFDLGGVQQEFFRVAVAEALDPKYGMSPISPTERSF